MLLAVLFGEYGAACLETQFGEAQEDQAEDTEQVVSTSVLRS